MRGRRDLGEQPRLDVLARDEQLDRLGRRRLDEILALADEEPELVAPAPLVQLADELELLVVARRDHAAMPRGALARQAASADLACSASLPNAAGSLIARSASTLRSSSTFAAFRPEMNWLYESPFARAPALMRMIQSRRNSRFLFLRSR